MHGQSRFTLRAAFLAAVVLITPACNRSSDDDDDPGAGPPPPPAPSTAEVEPNETFATATPIALGSHGAGNLLVAGDVDFWQFSATADDNIRIEIFAIRTDQATWNTAANRVIPTLFAADGTTPLFTGSTSGLFGSRDLDFITLRVVTTGAHFLRLAQSTPANAGGSYLIKVSIVALPSVQNEAEASGVSGVNDTFGTAQAITPGTVRGFHVDGEFDFYSFAITEPTVVRFAMTAHRNQFPAAATAEYDPEIDVISTDGSTILKTDDDDIFLDSGLAYQINTAGTYFLRVGEYSGNTTSGPYHLAFSTSAVGAATETEPNDTSATANALAAGATITGGIVDTDVADFYSISGTAGDEIHVLFMGGSENYEGAPLPDIPTIAFLAADGATVAPSSAPGSDLRILRAILQATGTHFIRITTTSTTELPYSLGLTVASSNPAEVEPNDTNAAATPLGGTNRASGVIATGTDVDAFSFTAGKDEVVVLGVFAGNTGQTINEAGWGSALQPLLTVQDGAGATLATSTSSPPSTNIAQGLASPLARIELVFVVPASGTYFAQVSSSSATGGPTRFYMIEKR
jgi:hypothetical protein